MDTNEFFKDVKLDNDTQKILTERYGKVSESIKSLSEEANVYKEKFEGSITDRDKAKKKVKEYEDKIKNGDFEGAKELKELNEKYLKDFEASEQTASTYKEQLEKANKDLKAKSDELDNLIKQQKENVLGKIPEKLRPSESLLEKMTVKDLNDFFEGLVKQNIIVDKSITVDKGGNHKAKTLAEWKSRYSMQ